MLSLGSSDLLPVQNGEGQRGTAAIRTPRLAELLPDLWLAGHIINMNSVRFVTVLVTFLSIRAIGKAVFVCVKSVCIMTRPNHDPFGPGSLADAIRAAVNTLKPEDRLHRRDVLKLGENLIVKRGQIPAQPPQDASGAVAARAGRDAFVFNKSVA